MEHKIGPVIEAHEAFAVYKDYDAAIQDSCNLVICATEALAEEVRDWCQRNDLAINDDPDKTKCNIGTFPYNKGYEHNASYQIRNTITRANNIATTFEKALLYLTPSMTRPIIIN